MKINHIILFISIFFLVSCTTTQDVLQTADTAAQKTEPEDTTAPVSSPVPAPGFEDVEEKVVVTEGQVKEFIVMAKQWEFIPATIEVNLGDTVKLQVTSTDVTHGFVLSEFGVNERLSPGKVVNIEFVADKAGTFGFYCSVPCGSGHGGMQGQLIVT